MGNIQSREFTIQLLPILLSSHYYSIILLFFLVGITSIILKKRIESGGGDNPYTVIYLPPKNLPDTSLDGEDPLSCCYTIGSDGRKISFRQVMEMRVQVMEEKEGVIEGRRSLNQLI